jgi:NhaP-type Na+/H+ or K+/H+ antiporter
MGVASSVLERLPVSPAMCYFAMGYALGPSGVNLVVFDLHKHAEVITLAAEIALLVSLLAVGLRLRVKLSDPLWLLPWRLGFGAMFVTIVLLAVAGKAFFGLPLGAAILLAAILAPTDPVLASEVQIRDVGDRDRMRFSLSGEGGLNDGTTYPFAMLGLFLLGMKDTDTTPFASQWAVAWSFWGIIGGLASGWLIGKIVVTLVLRLRKLHHQALGMEEFLGLGIIALAYGLSNVIHGIGFLAVFAAGVTMRGIEREETGEETPPAVVIGAVPLDAEEEVATHPEKAPAYMTEMVLEFNRQLEHIAEFAMVMLIGLLASTSGLSFEGLLIAALLLLIVRPLSVFAVLPGTRLTFQQRGLLAWFGIRGVGSFYYLMLTLQYPLDASLSDKLVRIVSTVLTVSIIAHGISATPLMGLYFRKRGWRAN